NLDSFGGSGSGLLDLSLQADDTSLGGILDEIYTNEDDDVAPAPDTEQATAEAMTAEVDQLPVTDETPEDEDAASMALATAAPVAGTSAEAAPDASSNMFGSLLLLSLLVLIYTAIVAWSASVSGKLPGIAVAITEKDLTWIVMGGLLVVSLVWAGLGAAKGSAGGGKAKAKKVKKPKKAKKAKAKKEKRPKEKKAKKALFGKKK
ncbi:hypothetical protein ACFL6U_14890, partial [Planctomycetota bacterium]